MDRQVNRPIFTWPAEPPRPSPGLSPVRDPDRLPTSPSGHSGSTAGSLLHRRSGLPPSPALREPRLFLAPRARGETSPPEREKESLCIQTASTEATSTRYRKRDWHPAPFRAGSTWRSAPAGRRRQAVSRHLTRPLSVQAHSFSLRLMASTWDSSSRSSQSRRLQAS